MRFSDRRRPQDQHRVNHRIRVPEVRLIDSDGSQLGVFITREALRRAEEAGLDLVEISPMARPPVCKIMDYGKFKYEQSKKMHEQKKKQTVIHIKEIKMRPSTDEHDFQTKMRHVRRFLEEGIKVKITIRFRGREMAHIDLGHDRMKRLLEEIKDIGEAEAYPKMEGRQLFMMLTPTKGKEKSKSKTKTSAESETQETGRNKGKRKVEVEVHSRPVVEKQAETK